MFLNITRRKFLKNPSNIKYLIFPISLYIIKEKIFLKTGKKVINSAEDNSEELNLLKNFQQKASIIERKLDKIIYLENFNLSRNDFPIFTTSNKSLLKNLFEEKGIKNIWNDLFFLKTGEGFTINDIIQPGLDTPDDPIGVVACSKSTYFTFDEILVSIAQILHKRKITDSLYEKENFENLKKIFIHDEKIKKEDDISETNKENKLGSQSSFKQMDSYVNLRNILVENILEIEVTAVRNFEGIPFSSKIHRGQRREISRKILEFIVKSDNILLGKNGKFAKFDPHSDRSIQSKDQSEFFRNCGFYRDWPDGRIIYFSKDNTLSIMTNEEDHLKLIYKAEKENFSLEKFSNFFEILNQMEKNNDFAFNQNLGYLASSPVNVGSGIYFKIILKVPEKKKDYFLNNFKTNNEIQIKQFKILEDEDKQNKEIAFEISNLSSFYNISKILKEINNLQELIDGKFKCEKKEI